jgi:flavin reductase (DIM6/NTAB) family NADH-FMN oxidoreductase RutF
LPILRDADRGYNRPVRLFCDERRTIMAKRAFPLSRVYRLLEPGPVVLVTTAQRGKQNVMTQSWHTMMEFEPPLVGCVISGRNHSFDALVATRECVISIPTLALAKQTVGVGNCSGKKVDKFKKFQLTPLPAAEVEAPLIAECYANLECRVADSRMVNKYNFFVLEVVKAWIDPAIKNPRTLHHQGNGVFIVGGDTIKLPSRIK